MLPDRIAGFVFEESERMGADPAGLALCTLMVASAAITNSIKIVPMRRNDRFSTTTLLWGMLVGPPGSKKSPIMAAALSPLEKVAEQWLNQDKEAMTSTASH
jgi:hypothetical protein